MYHPPTRPGMAATTPADQKRTPLHQQKTSYRTGVKVQRQRKRVTKASTVYRINHYFNCSLSIVDANRPQGLAFENSGLRNR